MNLKLVGLAPRGDKKHHLHKKQLGKMFSYWCFPIAMLSLSMFVLTFSFFDIKAHCTRFEPLFYWQSREDREKGEWNEGKVPSEEIKKLTFRFASSSPFLHFTSGNLWKLLCVSSGTRQISHNKNFSNGCINIKQARNRKGTEQHKLCLKRMLYYRR